MCLEQIELSYCHLPWNMAQCSMSFLIAPWSSVVVSTVTQEILSGNLIVSLRPISIGSKLKWANQANLCSGTCGYQGTSVAHYDDDHTNPFSAYSSFICFLKSGIDHQSGEFWCINPQYNLIRCSWSPACSIHSYQLHFESEGFLSVIDYLSSCSKTWRTWFHVWPQIPQLRRNPKPQFAASLLSILCS